MYLRLFHGRKDPSEQLDDWGSDGPIIGPANISWTYGFIKIEGEHLLCISDMIYFNEVYYGDVQVLVDDDPLIEEARQKNNLLDLQAFRTCLIKDVEKNHELPAETTVVLWMEGGVIHKIIADDPAVKVKVVDFDVFDGGTPENVLPFEELSCQFPDLVVSKLEIGHALEQQWETHYARHKQIDWTTTAQ